MFTKQLEEIGLNEKEAKVYIATLELGQGSAAEIAKKSGVNRATTYFTLENLMKIGLVSASNEEKKQLFVPEDPSQLENILERQKQAIEQKKVGLKDLIENLNSINSASVKKPIVKYYLGKDGVMRMADMSFDDVRSETMYVAFSKDNLNAFLGSDQNDRLRKKRISRNINSKALYNSKSETLPIDSKNLRIKLNSTDYPLPGDIAVYQNKIRLTSFNDNIGIIIENKDIAETFKSVFKLAIESAQNKNS
jgi:sugar-specific transcriptional regulator TrmB